MVFSRNKLITPVNELRNVLRRSPSFVVRSNITSLEHEIPVFTFHSIDPLVFDKQLRYLQENGYETLSTREYLTLLRGERKCSGKSVVLTIDDGRQSVWTYGYPLLKRYGMRAILFIPAGHVPEHVPGGDTSKPYGSIQKQDASQPLLSWDQLRTMHCNGVFEIQSHTLYHHPVYTTSRVRAVYTRKIPCQLYGRPIPPYYGLPVPREFEGQIHPDTVDVLDGMPIYEFQPLMEGRVRYYDDPLFRVLCRSHYEKYYKGAEDVVIQKQMGAFIRNHVKKQGLRGRLGTLKETYHEMIESLKKSKELIEQRIPGQTVLAVCFPFEAFFDLAIDMAVKVGYKACFCGSSPKRKSNRVGDTPFLTTRLKNDYIFRLPGEGRQSLSAILASKVARRLRGETGY